MKSISLSINLNSWRLNILIDFSGKIFFSLFFIFHSSKTMSAKVERKNSDKSERDRDRDEGMLDIGKHCTICRELDFLPFVCLKCQKSFCSNHRNEYNLHPCMIKLQQEKLDKQEREKADISKLPKSQSVFPDLNKIRKEAEIKYQAEQNRKIGQRLTNIKEDNNKLLTSVEVAMLRLKKLLGNTKSNNNSKSSSGMKLFSFGNNKSTNSTASRMIELNKLKRSAKGDSRIPINDRIYVWINYNSDDDTKFELKQGQFFSKRWPIGKMLDSSAELSKIKNVNNKEVDKSLKLAMFRRKRDDNSKNNDNNNEEEFIYIPTNGRVEKEIKDGDEIYILRGHR